eukprot:1766068-Prorocentrum_lima.AAC.1
MYAAASALWDFQAVWPAAAQSQLAEWLLDRARWTTTHTCRHPQWDLAITLWILEQGYSSANHG